jgi:DNA-binding beta-propeller fold protein YncE
VRQAGEQAGEFASESGLAISSMVLRSARIQIGSLRTESIIGREEMKKLKICFLVAALGLVAKAGAQEKVPPLQLLRTISRPGVHRRWDHFGVDLDGHRLFLASEDEAVVDVFDLRTNRLIHTITGLKKPHNILVRPDIKRIFVIDGEASEVKIFQYDSYQLIGRTQLTIDADPIAYDPSTKYLYVVNGGREAHTPYCLISVVDTESSAKLLEIKLNTNRLESMALEKLGSRLFVNMTGNNEIGVIDLQKHAVVQRWPIAAGEENSPMQFDEANHRLFVATRKPPKLVVVSTDTGKEIASLPVGVLVDDLAYDAANHRLYVPSGEGFITIVEQRSADDYRVIENLATAPGAKTARLVPELNRYFVAVPSTSILFRGEHEAKVLVFEVNR